MAGNMFVVNPSNSTYGYDVALGTGEGAMIANKISLVSCRVKFIICPNPYNAGSNPQPVPINIRFYAFKYKQNPVANPTNTSFIPAGGDFFENGSAGYSGFAGTLIDLNKRVNNDIYTYCGHRTFKIGNQMGYLGTNATTAEYQWSNNDYKYNQMFTWDLTKHCPKKQTHDSSGAWDQPRLWILTQVLNADNTTAALTTFPVTVTAQIEYRYKDF